MSSNSYAKCSCCERLFAFSVEKSLRLGVESPDRCGMCEHRDSLCQHNLFKRVAEGGPNITHSSKPCRVMGVKCEWIIFSPPATITRLRADRTDPELLSLAATSIMQRQS